MPIHYDTIEDEQNKKISRRVGKSNYCHLKISASVENGQAKWMENETDGGEKIRKTFAQLGIMQEQQKHNIMPFEL